MVTRPNISRLRHRLCGPSGQVLLILGNVGNSSREDSLACLIYSGTIATGNLMQQVVTPRELRYGSGGRLNTLRQGHFP